MTAPRCQRRRWDGTPLCSSPATVLTAGGCVHEHFAERHWCDVHAADALGETLACVLCRESSEPHNCLVRVTASQAVA